MSLIPINQYRFFLLEAFNKYIDSLPYEKLQFSAKQQDLEFYAIYTDIIVGN